MSSVLLSTFAAFSMPAAGQTALPPVAPQTPPVVCAAQPANAQTATGSKPLPAGAGGGASPTDSCGGGGGSSPVLPYPPTITSLTPGNGQVTVAFAPPTNFGSGTFLQYNVYSIVTAGGANGPMVSGASSPLVVTGLLNGTAYEFFAGTVTTVGQSTTPISSSVTPVGPPGAPTSPVATAGVASAYVTFGAAPANGGTTINYTVTSSGGQTASGTGTGITVSGLLAGTAYTFTVKATSSAGTGPASVASNSITTFTVPGVPSAPVAAVASASSVALTFSAPASNGGTAITGYTVTASGGQTMTAASSPLTFSGLTPGTPYTFTVKATNAAGTGAASAASNAVVPAGVPGAPGIGAVAAVSASSATVAFTAPANNGAAITSYLAVSTPGGLTATGLGSPLTVTGLQAGTVYTFKVTATNAYGAGAASAASNSITTLTAATVSFTPGAALGYTGQTLGAAVLNATASVAGTFAYTATPSGGSPVAVTAGTVLGAGSYTLTANFTPTNLAVYAAASAAAPFTVAVQHVWVAQLNGTVGALDAAGNAVNSGVTGGQRGLAIDAAGNVWSVNAAGTSMSKLSNTGAVLNGAITGGGLSSGSNGVAIDGNGTVWVSNAGNALSAFDNAGNALSPATGYTGAAGGSLSGPSAVAIDNSGSVWVANGTGATVTRFVGAAAPVASVNSGVVNNSLGVKP